MKNIKVKSYSLKKNVTTSSTNTKANIYGTAIQNNYFASSLNTERKKETNLIDKQNINPFSSTVLSDVDKIIKSPSLNISSKLDSKGNN